MKTREEDELTPELLQRLFDYAGRARTIAVQFDHLVNGKSSIQLNDFRYNGETVQSF